MNVYHLFYNLYLKINIVISNCNFMTLSFSFNKENVHRTWIWGKGFAVILSFYLANSKQYDAV